MAMEEKVLKVYDSSRHLILKAPLAKSRTFKVGVEMMEHKCLATAVKHKEWLWHYRFGPLNFKDLNKLQNKHMVTGLPQLQLPSEMCVDCLESKQPRSSFKQQVASRCVWSYCA